MIREHYYSIVYYTGIDFWYKWDGSYWKKGSIYSISSNDYPPDQIFNEIPNSSERSSPSMLNKDTMFYSYFTKYGDDHRSCIWRSTATGVFPLKTWVEDTTEILCINGEQVVALDPSVFVD